MAGIGFELRRALSRSPGLLSKLRSYSTAGLISSGPWIMTIVVLASLDVISSQFASRNEYELFRGLVTYAFCFSLIVVGGLQMAVTRRVADMLYTGRHDLILPAFNVSVLAVGAGQAAIGLTFCLYAGLPTAVSVAATALYVVVSVTWMALVWLNMTREHAAILGAYLAGLVLVGIALPLLGGADAVTLLTVFTAGQALTLAMLVRAVVRGLSCGGPRFAPVLDAPFEFPRIFIVGFAYNAAIWADKIVIWVFDGSGPHAAVQFHTLYDSSCFLAYLTAIPALAVNLVRLETSFYERYRAYYGAILGGHPLSSIERLRKEMIRVMAYNARRLLRLQAAITAAAILFAPQILAALGMPPELVPVFRAASFGAFFHVMLLITLLIQLYFDLRREALITSVVYLVLNTLLALVTVAVGPAVYGIGYAIASMVALFVAAVLLRTRLAELEYLTFARQPYPDPPAD